MLAPQSTSLNQEAFLWMFGNCCPQPLQATNISMSHERMEEQIGSSNSSRLLWWKSWSAKLGDNWRFPNWKSEQQYGQGLMIKSYWMIVDIPKALERREMRELTSRKKVEYWWKLFNIKWAYNKKGCADVIQHLVSRVRIVKLRPEIKKARNRMPAATKGEKSCILPA